MKKKFIIVISVIAVLGIIGLVLFLNNWGEYESTLEKSKIVTADSAKTESLTPSFSNLQGSFSVNAEESESAEILFLVDGLKNTKGAFEKFTVNFEVANSVESASLSVNIDASSINTGNEMRDEHLLEKDFFDVANYPTITYKSSSISWEDGIYTATGDLTLLGTTKALSFDFKHLGGGTNKDKVVFEAFEGEFVFDRTEYGMEEDASVGNEVTLSFYLELVK